MSAAETPPILHLLDGSNGDLFVRSADALATFGGRDFVERGTRAWAEEARKLGRPRGVVVLGLTLDARRDRPDATLDSIAVLKLSSAREGHVEGVRVSPRCKGRGLGKATVAATCAKADEIGVETLFYATHQRNPASIAVARSAGFCESLRVPYVMVTPHSARAEDDAQFVSVPDKAWADWLAALRECHPPALDGAQLSDSLDDATLDALRRARGRDALVYVKWEPRRIDELPALTVEGGGVERALRSPAALSLGDVEGGFLFLSWYALRPEARLSDLVAHLARWSSEDPTIVEGWIGVVDLPGDPCGVLADLARAGVPVREQVILRRDRQVPRGAGPALKP